MSVKFTIEISDELNKLLEEWAEREHRSKNGQINYFLEMVMEFLGVVKESWDKEDFDYPGNILEVGKRDE